MNTGFYGQLGVHKPRMLLVGMDQTALLEGISLTPGEGVLEAGMVLYGLGNGLYAPAAEADVTPTAALRVLMAEADTGVVPSGTGIVCGAYLTGRFARGALVLKGGGAVTAAAEQVLVGKGIFLTQTLPAEDAVPTFNNEVP